METVARQLVRGDIIPDSAALGTLGQHVPEHVAESPLRLSHLVISVQECAELRVVMAV